MNRFFFFGNDWQGLLFRVLFFLLGTGTALPAMFFLIIFGALAQQDTRPQKDLEPKIQEQEQPDAMEFAAVYRWNSDEASGKMQRFS